MNVKQGYTIPLYYTDTYIHMYTAAYMMITCMSTDSQVCLTRMITNVYMGKRIYDPYSREDHKLYTTYTRFLYTKNVFGITGFSARRNALSSAIHHLCLKPRVRGLPCYHSRPTTRDVNSLFSHLFLYYVYTSGSCKLTLARSDTVHTTQSPPPLLHRFPARLASTQ